MCDNNYALKLKVDSSKAGNKTQVRWILVEKYSGNLLGNFRHAVSAHSFLHDLMLSNQNYWNENNIKIVDILKTVMSVNYEQ